jgi:hypothetical protein
MLSPESAGEEVTGKSMYVSWSDVNFLEGCQIKEQ